MIYTTDHIIIFIASTSNILTSTIIYSNKKMYVDQWTLIGPFRGKKDKRLLGRWIGKAERGVKKKKTGSHLLAIILFIILQQKEPVDRLGDQHGGLYIDCEAFNIMYSKLNCKSQGQRWNSPWVSLVTSQLRSLSWDFILNSLHLLVSIWNLSHESKSKGYN